MISQTRIFQQLNTYAERNPEATALFIPGQTGLTYGLLVEQIRYVLAALAGKGVGRNDRVAIILSGEPEMAVAVAAVSCGATSAPLNPAYGAEELDFCFTDLDIKALMVSSSAESPSRAIAQKSGIPIFEITPVREETGRFEIAGFDSPQVQSAWAESDDVALVLHTSGTTARPKIVPLTHEKICASAGNIISTLQLTENDRCLTVMPHFHIHGLMVTLSSLLAGAAVCPARFSPQTFFRCLDEFAPTWYSSVPTIHQGVLRAAEAHREIIERSRLRFIRSSSASLPQRVMAELEKVFHAPVIEAYGMTEAAHQMASNPIPPKERKPSSVGLAAGMTQIAIMNESGRLLGGGETGEIVIRGGNVFGGYEHNPLANASSFTDGWFRTGDLGALDADGYLFIKGRIKEVINRGGEKISPAEVDVVLMSHPAVEQAVTFSIPHPTLGEDVAAAVVLRKNEAVAVSEIVDFTVQRLADFKVPRRLKIVDEIPKGPSGKLQRSGLATKLGFTSMVKHQEPTAPRDAFEVQLKILWEELLVVQPIDIKDNFFELGGDSLHAMQLLSHIQRIWGQDLALNALFLSPTIELLAKVLRERGSTTTSELLIPMKPSGSKPPFFCVYGVYHIARHMDPDQPFYALERPGMRGWPATTNIEDVAANYIKELQAMRPEGPYFLGGYSYGGVIAFEMAQQFQAQGHDVALLVLLEPAIPNIGGSDLLKQGAQSGDLIVRHLRNLARLTAKEKANYISTRVGEKFGAIKDLLACRYHLMMRHRLPQHLRLSYSLANGTQAVRKYAPKSYSGPALVLLAEESVDLREREMIWTRLFPRGAAFQRLPGNHFNIGEEPQAKAWAEQVSLRLKDVEVLYDAQAKLEPTG